MIPPIVTIAFTAAAFIAVLMRLGKYFDAEDAGGIASMVLAALLLAGALIAGAYSIDEAMRDPIACALYVEVP